MGVTSVSAAKKTGGSTTTSISTIGGNVGSTTLTTSTMPSHNHNVYRHSNKTGSLYGTYIYSQVSSASLPLTQTTGGSQSHTHSLSSTSHTHTITPPYYSLIYLVKLPK